MNSEFHHFVEKIVQQIDGNQAEKADLYEELMIHLELSSEQFIEQGLTEKEARRRAMHHFGDASVVGDQIQQAMFPFRKAMFLTLAATLILFSFAVYLALLFIEGDAIFVWLMLSIVISSVILLFALQGSPSLDRRRWLNMTLITHIFVYLFGMMAATGIDNTISIALTVFASIIILLAIILIYRTTIYDFQFSKYTITKQTQLLHFFNITVGIIVIALTLFFLWGFLSFSSDLDPTMFIFLIPLFIWFIFYLLQMKLLSKKQEKSAYVVAAIPFMLLVSILIWFSLSLFG